MDLRAFFPRVEPVAIGRAQAIRSVPVTPGKDIAPRAGNGAGHGGAARGYSWPPFEQGNTAAVTHGARSDRLVEPRAREIAQDVLALNPHLDSGRDGPAVVRYSVALARIERVYAWLGDQADEVFVDVAEGRVHAVYERLEQWERQASAAEDRLAIAPLTRTKLGLDLQRAAMTEGERLQAEAARKKFDERASGVVDSGATEEAEPDDGA